ncbi:polysaccharide pyruvyl transferase family protein [Anabaena subtropica]|uniref:Polysaccharide pyruvyl transferase family protein n=1 Tax=Anabaena subtropica FACHB-260 TaxID=2692884 RepID=A0ABR8CJT0_9NOST|nr:polysaccharide pyruvyl transferase family protein [Anabaena subtropica]MBD2343487.1 polysaccharide pyruvyl transferase family protein [Anabaena subtropica FACHB-260]
MSKKIGIITYHFTINYGATLQAYALSHFLKDNGYDVEIIDYRPRSLRWEDIKYLYFSKHSFLDPKLIIKSQVKKSNMNNFVTNNLNLSSTRFYEKINLKQHKHEYDCVICGSDEIWNINTHRGLDEAYFIDFIAEKDTTKISYAASCGSTKFFGDHEELLSTLLRNFHAVSVRDNNSLSLIKSFDINAKKVLDPTFLVDYKNVMRVPNNKNKYVLVYGLLKQREAIYVKKIAEKEGLDIISIGSPQSYLKPFLKLDLFDISPEDWLGFFYNASFIATQFFHGVIFSIIFNKPFIVFDRQTKSIKVRDLLSFLELENRIINLSDSSKIAIDNYFNLILHPIDNIQKIKLDNEIQLSKKFLHESLK